jgi:hypothetical protein
VRWTPEPLLATGLGGLKNSHGAGQTRVLEGMGSSNRIFNI